MKTPPKTATLALFTLLLTLVCGSQAFAFPLTSQRWEQKPALGLFYVNGFNFDGIIALSNCSGSLVRFKSTLDTEKALVLTNGHCFSKSIFGGMISPGEIISNFNQKNVVKILAKDGSSIKSLTTARVLYAAMTSTDVTLFELTESYADIAAATGAHALTIADTAPPTGTPIQIPSGYWKRTYSCQTDITVPELREAGYTFKNSIRFSEPGCETIGGTSGSPLVSTATGEVIGINNTGNDDGEECTENNPCEVDSNGTISVHKGRSYGQQTYLFYGCLSQGPDRLDFNLPTCQLVKP